MNAMVDARNVYKKFGALEVLRGITLNVQPGEVTCIIGPSGSGKSTFLRCINHLEQIDAGRLYVDGELVGYVERDNVLHEMPLRKAARQRRDIGMVFQRFNLFPHVTALDNITMSMVHVKRRPRSRPARAAWNFWRWSACPPRPTPTPPRCPAGSCSEWRSPAPWQWIRS